MCYLLKTQKQYVSVSYSKNQSDETVSMTPEQTWSAEENQKLQEKKLPLRFSGGFAQWICFRRNDRFKTSQFTALKKESGKCYSGALCLARVAWWKLVSVAETLERESVFLKVKGNGDKTVVNGLF